MSGHGTVRRGRSEKLRRGNVTGNTMTGNRGACAITGGLILMVYVNGRLGWCATRKVLNEIHVTVVDTKNADVGAFCARVINTL